MAKSVYVSRLGERLRDQGLGIGDLQRRLATKGHRVSRGALERLVSPRPIGNIRLDVVVPVLQELRVNFEAAFETADSDEVASRLQARAGARALARRVYRSDAERPNAESTAESDPDAELRAVVSRSAAALRERRPDLFDSRGRLRQKLLAEAIADALRGETALSKERYDTLTAPDVLAVALQGGSPAPR